MASEGDPPVEHSHSSKGEGSAGFLRAARSGHLDKVLELLRAGTDINSSNANGLNALHLASKEGHSDVVRELLKRKANVDAATRKGNTALHIASLAGQNIIVTILVENGANVNVQSLNGFTPLYMAAQENHEEVVRFLLSHGANQALSTEDGFTPLAVALQQGHDRVVALLLENDTKGKVRLPALHIAAKKDDTKAATLLLQNDHNADVTSKSGFTPLHIAAHYGNENVAQLLIEKGANVNYTARHNISPLHVATKWGRTNMVQLLLQNGAIIDSRTRDLLTPLHCAARSGHDQVVDMLLEKGAPISAKTKNGLAPLHMAAQGDHVDSARILLYHRAPVDDVTVDYLTPLHVAAHCGHVRVAKLLLDRNADPNARALNGFTPLHIACKKNRIKVVELLLKYHASIEATTESGLSPLHVASFMGAINIVIYLLQQGANPDVATVRGETPLHLAARANQTDVVRVLIRNGAKVDAQARELQTPLHIASRLGNTDIVILLLQAGANPNSATRDLYSPLHIAAKEGQDEVAGILLDHGADKNLLTKKGFTPLHLASKYGNLEVVKLLLEKGCPVDIEGKNQVTPLHVAAHYNNDKVAMLLLEHGASAKAAAKNGYTPLHIAAKKNQMDIAGTLLQYHADPNAKSRAGFTPLHLASQEGHREMAGLLIENGSDVGAKANNGLTSMHLCAQEDHVPVAEELYKHRADINPQTNAGYTPLHVACHFGQLNMVRFLVEHGANVGERTRANFTPLHQAAQQGHNNVVRYLLDHGASPNEKNAQGQTPLAIAQRLGYVSVVETLKTVTETTVITETTTVHEDKYKPQNPEAMNETMFSESEDEGAVAEHEAAAAHAKDFSDNLTQGLVADSTGIHLIHVGEQLLNKSSELEAAKFAPDAYQDNLDDLIRRAQVQPVHTAPIMNDSLMDKSIQNDNIPIGHNVAQPSKLLHKTFLISFLVDARGGAMRGCRHSGVRIIVPPRKASQPIRVTCRYLRKDKLAHPPPLSEGEELASRILEMAPAGAKFLGPVILEVPHFASLRDREREIVILRSDDGQHWKEHQLEATEDAVQEVLNESFDAEELAALDDLQTPRITRILTNDFPMYFAVVTRVRQEVHCVGPEGGVIVSSVVPKVQAIFPDGSLTKTIKVSVQAQPVPQEMVTRLHGNRVAVSPIVTVEPRRRKFHKPITLCIPLPQSGNKAMLTQYSGQPGQEPPTLRLLCSITGGSAPAQWEDITGTTQLTFTGEEVSFTTTVSARFWLMDCQTPRDAARMAQEVYNEAISIPYMAKFAVFARRTFPVEGQLRVFCMTDDKEDKTLEKQEHFRLIAKSRDVEVLKGKHQFLEFAGNLVPVTKSGDQLSLYFQPFQENRLAFMVKTRNKDDTEADTEGRLAFMREPKNRSEALAPQAPICTLAITLPEYTGEIPAPIVVRRDTTPFETKYKGVMDKDLPEFIHPNVLKGVGPDWQRLARALEVPHRDIQQVRHKYPGKELPHALKIWIHLKKEEATPENLDTALKRIGRDDIVRSVLHGEPETLSYGSESPSSKRYEKYEPVALEPSKKYVDLPPVPIRGVSAPAVEARHVIQHEESHVEEPEQVPSAAYRVAEPLHMAEKSQPQWSDEAEPVTQTIPEEDEEAPVSEVRTVVRTERHVHDTDDGPVVEERTITTTYEDDVAINEAVIDKTVPLTEEELEKWNELHRLAEESPSRKLHDKHELPEGVEQDVETEQHVEDDGTIVTTTTMTSHYTETRSESPVEKTYEDEALQAEVPPILKREFARRQQLSPPCHCTNMSANPVVLGLTASGELLIQGIVQDQGISSETIHHVGSKSRFEAESWSGEHEERQHQEDRRYSLVHDNEAAKGQDEDTPIASSEHFERKRTPSLAAALLEIDPQGVPLIHFFHPTSDTPLLEAEEEAVEIEDAGESEKVISSLLFLLREMKMKEPEKYTIAVQRLRELEAELRTAGAVTPADPAVSDAVARALAASGPGRDIQIRVNQSRHTTTTKTVYETETPGMAGLDPEKIRELHQQMLASITSGHTDSSADSGTTQKKESAEEGFTNEDGSVVVSKKMTRVVTTTKTTLPGEGEAPAPDSPTESLGSVKDRIARFESLKEGDQASVESSGSEEREPTARSERSYFERATVDIVVTPVSPVPPGQDEEDEIAEAQDPLSPSVEEVSQAEVKSVETYGEEQEEQEPLSPESDRSSTADILSNEPDSGRRQKKREILEQSTTTTYDFSTSKEDRRRLQQGAEGEHPEEYAGEHEEGYQKETALESPAEELPRYRADAAESPDTYKPQQRRETTEHTATTSYDFTTTKEDRRHLEHGDEKDQPEEHLDEYEKTYEKETALESPSEEHPRHRAEEAESPDTHKPHQRRETTEHTTTTSYDFTTTKEDKRHLDHEDEGEQPEEQQLGAPEGYVKEKALESPVEDSPYHRTEVRSVEYPESTSAVDKLKDFAKGAGKVAAGIVAAPVALAAVGAAAAYEKLKGDDEEEERQEAVKDSPDEATRYEEPYTPTEEGVSEVKPVEEIPRTPSPPAVPEVSSPAKSEDEPLEEEGGPYETTTITREYEFTPEQEETEHVRDEEKPHHFVESTTIVTESFYDEPSPTERESLGGAEEEAQEHKPHHVVETTTITREYDLEPEESPVKEEVLRGEEPFEYKAETEAHVPRHVVETTTIRREYDEEKPRQEEPAAGGPESFEGLIDDFHMPRQLIEEVKKEVKSPEGGHHVVETTTTTEETYYDEPEAKEELLSPESEQEIPHVARDEETPEPTSPEDHHVHKIIEKTTITKEVFEEPEVSEEASPSRKTQEREEFPEERHAIETTTITTETSYFEEPQKHSPVEEKQPVAGKRTSIAEHHEETTFKESPQEEQPYEQIGDESDDERGVGDKLKGLVRGVGKVIAAPVALAAVGAVAAYEKLKRHSDEEEEEPRPEDVAETSPTEKKAPTPAKRTTFEEPIATSSPIEHETKEAIGEHGEPVVVGTTTVTREYYEEPESSARAASGEEEHGKPHHIVEVTTISKDYYDEPEELRYAAGEEKESPIEEQKRPEEEEEPFRHIVETTTITREYDVEPEGLAAASAEEPGSFEGLVGDFHMPRDLIEAAVEGHHERPSIVVTTAITREYDEDLGGDETGFEQPEDLESPEERKDTTHFHEEEGVSSPALPSELPSPPPSPAGKTEAEEAVEEHTKRESYYFEPETSEKREEEPALYEPISQPEEEDVKETAESLKPSEGTGEERVHYRDEHDYPGEGEHLAERESHPEQDHRHLEGVRRDGAIRRHSHDEEPHKVEEGAKEHLDESEHARREEEAAYHEAAPRHLETSHTEEQHYPAEEEDEGESTKDKLLGFAKGVGMVAAGIVAAPVALAAVGAAAAYDKLKGDSDEEGEQREEHLAKESPIREEHYFEEPSDREHHEEPEHVTESRRTEFEDLQEAVSPAQGEYRFEVKEPKETSHDVEPAELREKLREEQEEEEREHREEQRPEIPSSLQVQEVPQAPSDLASPSDENKLPVPIAPTDLPSNVETPDSEKTPFEEVESQYIVETTIVTKETYDETETASVDEPHVHHVVETTTTRRDVYYEEPTEEGGMEPHVVESTTTTHEASYDEPTSPRRSGEESPAEGEHTIMTTITTRQVMPEEPLSTEEHHHEPHVLETSTTVKDTFYEEPERSNEPYLEDIEEKEEEHIEEGEHPHFVETTTTTRDTTFHDSPVESDKEGEIPHHDNNREVEIFTKTEYHDEPTGLEDMAESPSAHHRRTETTTTVKEIFYDRHSSRESPIPSDEEFDLEKALKHKPAHEEEREEPQHVTETTTTVREYYDEPSPAEESLYSEEKTEIPHHLQEMTTTERDFLEQPEKSEHTRPEHHEPLRVVETTVTTRESHPEEPSPVSEEHYHHEEELRHRPVERTEEHHYPAEEEDEGQSTKDKLLGFAKGVGMVAAGIVAAPVALAAVGAAAAYDKLKGDSDEEGEQREEHLTKESPIREEHYFEEPSDREHHEEPEHVIESREAHFEDRYELASPARGPSSAAGDFDKTHEERRESASPLKEEHQFEGEPKEPAHDLESPAASEKEPEYVIESREAAFEERPELVSPTGSESFNKEEQLEEKPHHVVETTVTTTETYYDEEHQPHVKETRTTTRELVEEGSEGRSGEESPVDRVVETMTTTTERTIEPEELMSEEFQFTEEKESPADEPHVIESTEDIEQKVEEPSSPVVSKRQPWEKTEERSPFEEEQKTEEGEHKDEEDLHRVVETFTTQREYYPEETLEEEEQLHGTRVVETVATTKESFYDEPSPVEEEKEGHEAEEHDGRLHHVRETTTVTTETFYEEPETEESELEKEGDETGSVVEQEVGRPSHVVETTTTVKETYFDESSPVASEQGSIQEPGRSESAEQLEPHHIVETTTVTKETYFDEPSPTEEDKPHHVVESTTTVRKTTFEEADSPHASQEALFHGETPGHEETVPVVTEETITKREVFYDEPEVEELPPAEHAIESEPYAAEAQYEEPMSPVVKERQFEEAEDYQQGLESAEESDEEATSPTKKKKGLGSKIIGLAKKAGVAVVTPVALAAKGASSAYDALTHRDQKDIQGEEVMHDQEERVYTFKGQESDSEESPLASPETARKAEEPQTEEKEHVIPSEEYEVSTQAHLPLDVMETHAVEKEKHVIESEPYEDLSQAPATTIKVDTVADEEEEEDVPEEEKHIISSTDYHPSHYEEQIRIDSRAEQPEEEEDHVIESVAYEEEGTTDTVHEPEELRTSPLMRRDELEKEDDGQLKTAEYYEEEKEEQDRASTPASSDSRIIHDISEEGHSDRPFDAEAVAHKEEEGYQHEPLRTTEDEEGYIHYEKPEHLTERETHQEQDHRHLEGVHREGAIRRHSHDEGQPPKLEEGAEDGSQGEHRTEEDLSHETSPRRIETSYEEESHYQPEEEGDEESTKDKFLGFMKGAGKVAAGIVAAPVALAAVGAVAAYDKLKGDDEKERETREEHLMKESPLREEHHFEEPSGGEQHETVSPAKEEHRFEEAGIHREEEPEHVIESREAHFGERHELASPATSPSPAEHPEEALKHVDESRTYEEHLETASPVKEGHQFEEELKEPSHLESPVSEKEPEYVIESREAAFEEHPQLASPTASEKFTHEEQLEEKPHHVVETTVTTTETYYDEENQPHISEITTTTRKLVEDEPSSPVGSGKESPTDRVVETTTVTTERIYEPEELVTEEQVHPSRHEITTTTTTREIYGSPEELTEEEKRALGEASTSAESAHEETTERPHLIETTTTTTETHYEPDDQTGQEYPTGESPASEKQFGETPEEMSHAYEIEEDLHEPRQVTEITTITRESHFYEEPSELSPVAEEGKEFYPEQETGYAPQHLMETTTMTTTTTYFEEEPQEETPTSEKSDYEYGQREDRGEQEKEPALIEEQVHREPIPEEQLYQVAEPSSVLPSEGHFAGGKDLSAEENKEPAQEDNDYLTAPVVSSYTASGEPITTGLVISAPASPARHLPPSEAYHEEELQREMPAGHHVGYDEPEQKDQHVHQEEEHLYLETAPRHLATSHTEEQHYPAEEEDEGESTKDKLLGFAKGVGMVAAGIVAAPVALAAVGAAAAYDKLKGDSDEEGEQREEHLMKESPIREEHRFEEPSDRNQYGEPESRAFEEHHETVSPMQEEHHFEETDVHKEKELEHVIESREAHFEERHELASPVRSPSSAAGDFDKTHEESLKMIQPSSPVTTATHFEESPSEAKEFPHKEWRPSDYEREAEFKPEEEYLEERLSPESKMEISHFVTDVVEEATAGAVIEAAEDLTPRSQRESHLHELEELALENVTRMRFEEEPDHLQSPEKQSEESPSSDRDESRLIAGDDEWKVYDSTGQVVEEFSAQLTDRVIEDAGADVIQAISPASTSSPASARRLVAQESMNEVAMEPEVDYQSDLQEKLDILAGQKSELLPMVREEELDVIHESEGESEEPDPINETAARLVDEVIETVLEEHDGGKTSSDYFYTATEKSKDDQYDTCVTSQEDTFETAQGWTSQDSEYTTATSEAPSRLSEMEERTEGTTTPQAALSPVDSDRQFVVDLDKEQQPVLSSIRSFTLDDETARSTPDVALQITIEEEDETDEGMVTSPSGVLLAPHMDPGRPISPVPPRKQQTPDDEEGAFVFVARDRSKDLETDISIDVPETPSTSDVSDESARYTRHSSDVSSEVSHADTVIHKEQEKDDQSIIDEQLPSTFVSHAGSSDSLDKASVKSTGRRSSGSSIKAPEEPTEPEEKESPKSQDLSPEQTNLSPHLESPHIEHQELETEEGFVMYQREGDEQGELETVEEEPEDGDSLNGGSGNSSIGAPASLAKYKHVSSDNVSLTSLQEFERLEQLVASKGDSSLTASEIELYTAGRPRSMEGSMSSLAEFERLEQEMTHQANQSPQDEMMLSVVKEESEAEDMSIRDDDEDEAFSETEIKSRPVNEEDMRAGTPQALSPSDSLERDVISNIAILETSTDSLEPSFQQKPQTDIMADSLTEYDVVPRMGSARDSLENIPMDKDSLLEASSQDQTSQETHGLLSGDTVGTYQEHDDDDKDSLGGEMESMLRSYPTTLTTFETTTIAPDGSVQTISRRVETRVVDPVMSHVEFTGTESQERLNQLPLEQPIDTVDAQGNVTRTLFKRQPPHSE